MVEAVVAVRPQDDLWAGEIAGEALSLRTVANGKHALLPGVYAVEFKARKKIAAPPSNLTAMLKRRGASEEFEALINALVSSKNTATTLGRWLIKNVAAEVALRSPRFQSLGVKVYACERRSEMRRHAWIEFVDVDDAQIYVPQYDVTSLTSKCIEVPYFMIRFPRGVYIEQLKQRDPREQLRNETPEDVYRLLVDKILVREYADLVDACLATEYTLGARWNPAKLAPVVAEHRPNFVIKGVDLHLSYKVTSSQSNLHPSNRLHVWLEFIDRDLQPNYVPQRAVGFGARSGNFQFRTYSNLGGLGYRRTNGGCILQ